MRGKKLALFLSAAMICQNALPAAAAALPEEPQNGVEASDGPGPADTGIEAYTGETRLKDAVLNYGKYTFDGSVGAIGTANEDAGTVAGLSQGSFSIAYKLEDTAVGSVIAGLFSVSDSTQENSYGALYVKPSGNKIGFEVRSGKSKEISLPAGKSLQNTDWHTITYAFDGNHAAIYFDGELAGGADGITNVLAAEAWAAGANAVSIGGIQRNNNNKWTFAGKVDSVRVYDSAVSAGEAAQIHAEILPEPEDPVEDPDYGENVFKSAEYGLYDMGDFGSFNYRIPALATTANGTLIAAADQRNTHWSDWGNIDTVIRRSTDQGQSWSDPIKVVDLKSQPYFSGTQSAYTIDPVLLAEDEEGLNPGRVWLLVDMFPEAAAGAQGTNSVTTPGSGYVEAGGARYLALYDKDNNVYTLREQGNVYDSDGNKTAWKVDTAGSRSDAYHEIGDMYENGEYVGNIYLKSQNKKNESAPLHVFQTSYLWLSYSDDDGLTWSEPVDLNGQIKEEWMRFCGTGPGFGIQMKQGAYKNRLVFPIYYTIAGNGIGFQSSANIYSDDGGVTWHRGESPNDGRINSSGNPTSSQNPVGITELTESQIIELNNGHLLQFMRNTGGKVAVARSADGGATWDDPVNYEIPEVYCQLSVLHYPELVGGKEYVVLSNPGGTGRNNGTLRIGEVQSDDSITWVDSKMFCPGNYAYSCLTYMGQGKMGLMYEHMNTIKFASFNLDYIKDPVVQLSPNITSVSYTVEKSGEHKYTLPGDSYLITVNMNQEIEVAGAPKFRFMLNGVGKYADYVSAGADGKSVVFRYVVQEGDEGQISYKGPKIISDGENYVRNGKGLLVSAGDLDVDLGYIGTDPTDEWRDIPADQYTVTDGSHQTGNAEQGDGSLAVDNNTNTMWHTSWGGTARENQWIKFDLGGEYLVDGLRYLPRQTGGINGIITEYRIEVSSDDVNYTPVAEGTWAGNTQWKKVSFSPVKAAYVRLVSVDSLSNDAGKEFSSAAEIRITGTEAPVIVVDKEALKNAVASAKEILKNESDYLTRYVEEIRGVLAQAEPMLEDENLTQEQVNEVALRLKELADNPVLKGDKDSLKTALEEMREIKLEDYKPESIADLETAMDQAEELLKQEELTVKEVADAIQALDDGKAKLELKDAEPPVEPVDKKELQKSYDLAMKKVESDYTAESWAAFAAARDQAAKVLGDENAAPEDVKAALDLLSKTESELLKAEKPVVTDKSGLKKAVEAASKLKKADYTESTWKKFETALANARKVLDDENATAAQVEEVMKALETAQKGLTKVTPTPGKGDKDGNTQKTPGVKTGDETPIGLLAGMAAVALLAVGTGAVILYRRKRHNS